MKLLYLDCSMGAAGDMLSAALLELFPNREEILEKLNGIKIPGIKYEAERSAKCGIYGTHLKVSYLGQEEKQGEYPAHHHHTGMKDIDALIKELNLSEDIKEKVRDVYKIIADAEARVHGMEPEFIHFHELGTMDALADISAFCYLLSELKPKKIIASAVRTGYGSVRCTHGLMPVPAPATANILKGIPVYAGDIEGEMCTPTGAALIKYFAGSFGNMPLMSIEQIGYGAGTKSFADRPNLLRAMLGEKE